MGPLTGGIITVPGTAPLGDIGYWLADRGVGEDEAGRPLDRLNGVGGWVELKGTCAEATSGKSATAPIIFQAAEAKGIFIRKSP